MFSKRLKHVNGDDEGGVGADVDDDHVVGG
jgi:hypothetical protein